MAQLPCRPRAGRNARRNDETFLPPKALRFFVCTRDRPQALGLCLDSLSGSLKEALPGLTAHCYILDDSTTPALSTQVRRLSGASACAPLQIKIIDRGRQHAIYQQLAALHPESLRLLKCTCRMLGRGPWDLAGVRNFAFLLAYCYSNENDIIIFLDDDILLTSSAYGGHFIEIEGVSLIRQLLSSIRTGQLIASGTTYFGRLDGSILDHLRLYFTDLTNGMLSDLRDPEARAQMIERLQQISLFPSTLPARIVLPGGRAALKSGPGISGALLVTTPAALLSHPLPRCYNEDWIWLSLLGQPGASIRRVRLKALHAAPPQAPIKSDFVAYQNTGEVVYRAVRAVMKDAASCRNALERCWDTISVDHLLRAKQGLAREIRSLLQAGMKLDKWLDGTGLLSGEAHLRASVRSAIRGVRRCGKDALESVEATDYAALYRWFQGYLRGIPKWRRLLRESREAVGEEVRRHGGC